MNALCGFGSAGWLKPVVYMAFTHSHVFLSEEHLIFSFLAWPKKKQKNQGPAKSTASRLHSHPPFTARRMSYFLLLCVMA